MTLPRISIVTPSFNQGAFLEETVTSVLDQKYPNLEYIIIDGGSTDQSKEIIKRFEKHLTYWVSEKDSGQSEAINKGLRLVTGEITGWLCSDDLYLPGALHKAAEVFEQNPDSMMIHGKSIIFDEAGKEIVKGADVSDLSLRYFTVIPFPQPSSFFRKKLIDAQGLLDERLHFAMDYDLLVRTALYYRITPVEDIFSRYRLHKESKTGSKLESFAEEWCNVFSKFLRSVNSKEEDIKMLEQCGLYKSGTDQYKPARNFPEKDLRKIILYYLEFMAHFNYQLLNKSRTIEIASVIKQMDQDFFHASDLHKITFRSKYLPAGMIKWLRNLK